MKKLLVASLLFLIWSPAFAQKTKAQLTTEIGTTYPDNTIGSITPAGVRTYETDVLNSIMPTAPVVAGNLACFSGTTGLLQDCGSAPATVPLTIGTTPILAGTTAQVLYDNAGILGQYSNVQLTALIQLATATNSGAIPAWPNNTTTFFRGDGTYATLDFAAIGGQATLAQFPTGVSDTALGYWGSTVASALAVGNCSNALTYSTTTHAFGCNTLAGTGTVTSAQISAGAGIAVATTSGANPCVSTCNLTVSQTLTNATLTATPANPASTTNTTTGVMMGLGSTCHITPVYSGRLRLEIYGSLSNATIAAGTEPQLMFGTGVAPANGVATTGTALGSRPNYNPGSASANTPFNLSVIATGLTVGTAIWFDISLLVGAGTGSILAVTCVAMEF